MNNFQYNGVCYYAGTIVKFNDGKYGRYRGYNNGFDYVELKNGEYVDTNWMTFEASENIKEIVYPITFFNRKFVKVQNDTQNDDMFYAWVLYIVYMLFVTITTNAILGWIIGTIVFLIYRHGKLYKEINKK